MLVKLHSLLFFKLFCKQIKIPGMPVNYGLNTYFEYGFYQKLFTETPNRLEFINLSSPLIITNLAGRIMSSFRLRHSTPCFYCINEIPNRIFA